MSFSTVVTLTGGESIEYVSLSGCTGSTCTNGTSIEVNGSTEPSIDLFTTGYTITGLTTGITHIFVQPVGTCSGNTICIEILGTIDESATPTPTATNTPTPTPTSTPGTTPDPTPDPTPGATPSNTPTNTPSSTPGATPSNTPTNTPTPTPTVTPTLTPTPSATPEPTPLPTAVWEYGTSVQESNNLPGDNPSFTEETGTLTVSNGTMIFTVTSAKIFNYNNISIAYLEVSTIGNISIQCESGQQTVVSSSQLTVPPGTYTYTLRATLNILSPSTSGAATSTINEV